VHAYARVCVCVRARAHVRVRDAGRYNPGHTPLAYIQCKVPSLMHIIQPLAYLRNRLKRS
jgi:hypothetical protein